MIELGDEVKDQVTGFSGVVTGRVLYITGCTQFCVEPKGKPGDTKWLDDIRLLIVKRGAFKVNKAKEKTVNMGGPRTGPVRAVPS